MIVADTNVWIAYLAGETGEDVSLLDSALAADATAMAPMVLSELLTAPGLASEHARSLSGIRLLSLAPDYWVRVGRLRAALQVKRYRARLVDTMIAQLCMDHQATLLTRDAGFKRFAGQGLKLHL